MASGSSESNQRSPSDGRVGVEAMKEHEPIHSNYQEDSVMPLTPSELQATADCIKALPPIEQDLMLSRVLESIRTGVHFSDPTCPELYLGLIQSLSITSTRTCRAASAAVLRCSSEPHMGSVGDALLTSIVWALRLGRSASLSRDEVTALVSSANGEKGLAILEKLINENLHADWKHRHMKPIDASLAYKAIESAGHAFSGIDDFLQRIESNTCEHPGVAKQTRVILRSIFTRHEHLVQEHIKVIAIATNKVNYCPAEALSLLMAMLCTANSNTAAVLDCLGNIDLNHVSAEQLSGIITSLTELCNEMPAVTKDVLSSLDKLLGRLFTKYKDKAMQVNTKDIFDLILALATDKRATPYQQEVVGFLERLYEYGLLPRRDVCFALLENAKQISVVEKLCGILLRIRTKRSGPDSNMLDKVRAALRQWYPNKKEQGATTKRLELIRDEQPNVYGFLNQTYTEQADSTDSNY